MANAIQEDIIGQAVEEGHNEALNDHERALDDLLLDLEKRVADVERWRNRCREQEANNQELKSTLEVEKITLKMRKEALDRRTNVVEQREVDATREDARLADLEAETIRSLDLVQMQQSSFNQWLTELKDQERIIEKVQVDARVTEVREQLITTMEEVEEHIEAWKVSNKATRTVRANLSQAVKALDVSNTAAQESKASLDQAIEAINGQQQTIDEGRKAKAEAEMLVRQQAIQRKEEQLFLELEATRKEREELKEQKELLRTTLSTINNQKDSIESNQMRLLDNKLKEYNEFLADVQTRLQRGIEDMLKAKDTVLSGEESQRTAFTTERQSIRDEFRESMNFAQSYVDQLPRVVMAVVGELKSALEIARRLTVDRPLGLERTTTRSIRMSSQDSSYQARRREEVPDAGLGSIPGRIWETPDLDVDRLNGPGSEAFEAYAKDVEEQLRAQSTRNSGPSDKQPTAPTGNGRPSKRPRQV